MEVAGNAEKKVSFLKMPSRVPKKKRKCVSLFKKSTWGVTDCLYDKSLASSADQTRGSLTDRVRDCSFQLGDFLAVLLGGVC